MARTNVALAALIAVAACGEPAPMAEGVGFGDYQPYGTDRSELHGMAPLSASGSVPRRNPPGAVPATQPGGAPVTVAANLSNAEAAPGGSGSTWSPASVRRTLDGAVEEPADPPQDQVAIAQTTQTERPSPIGRTIIDFALSTSHPVGQSMYSREPGNAAGQENACAAFRSADLAQDWFLSHGGPANDPRGLDPDGDGYACGWTPEVYRAAAGAARD